MNARHVAFMAWVLSIAFAARAGDSETATTREFREPLSGLLAHIKKAPYESYGLPTPAEKFGEATRHVGFDCGWGEPGRTVQAMAAGRVRYAGHVPTILWDPEKKKADPDQGKAVESGPDGKPVTLKAMHLPGKQILKWGWGGLIIVEHRLPPDKPGGKGRVCCSLYGHLGSGLTVKEGQEIDVGQKLGVIGDGPGAENGWYLTHLHFGIHDGPYTNPPTHIPVRVNGREISCRVIDLDQKNVYVDLEGQREPVPVQRYWERFLVPNTAGRLYPNWVTGYIRQEEDAAAKGWLDPIAFLRARIKP